jgi:hypothetical protein
MSGIDGLDRWSELGAKLLLIRDPEKAESG